VTARTGDICLRVSGLTKRYGALCALDRVSFEVRRGEVLGLIGPNGSGKTTLFECIGGVLPFDAGAVEPSVRSGAPSQLFYLPDSIAPWPAQTVSWSLDFCAGYFSAPSGLREAVIAALALQPLLHQRLGELSKGQRKRALLAIGLLTARPIVLADEPFDGLDLKQTREVGAALRGFAGAGRTLVLSIHQISDAARVCDRFVLLSNGTVRGAGTIDEVVQIARGAVGTSGTAATLEEAFLALT
jgi:ABC-type multidrug transport system ATPase subunit